MAMVKVWFYVDDDGCDSGCDFEAAVNHVIHKAVEEASVDECGNLFHFIPGLDYGQEEKD